MDKVFVVIGQTGEYSDRTEWSVIAYENEADAIELVRKADEWLLANGCRHGHPYPYTAIREVLQQCPFDPNIRVDYTGTSYYYISVPFVGAKPDVL